MRSNQIIAGERTRPQVGMVILLTGEEYRVEMVNFSRAWCTPLKKRRVIIRDKVWGKTREFMAKRKSINISPDSEVVMVRWEKEAR